MYILKIFLPTVMPKETPPECETLIKFLSKENHPLRTIQNKVSEAGFSVSKDIVNRVIKNEGKLRSAVASGLATSTLTSPNNQ